MRGFDLLRIEVRALEERVAALEAGGGATIDATDSALELAREEGIDLSGVKGTGKDGRIVKSDVEAAIADAE